MEKIASFISMRRRAVGLTQQEIANKLNISFQAVSKWESGVSYPSIEVLLELSELLGVTVNELLAGQESGNQNLTYSKAGVDINYTDAIKKEIEKYVVSENKRVLNGVGPFASLYDIKFDGIAEPVLVLKSEEPGSKQKLAMEYGYMESVCHDMINHLVNDIIVMGAKPLAVLDTIVCGSAEKDTISSIVKGISEACKNNDCSLVGGETSIQPDVVEKGTYILTSSIAGIVEKSEIIDGSTIEEGDAIIAVASNGLHTNGYSLVRLLMKEMPNIVHNKIEEDTFVESIMKPHLSYQKAVKDLVETMKVSGMAHITGGGIKGNLKRIIPEGLSAQIDLSSLKILPIFQYLKENGNIKDEEMLRTFNCGVGFIVVAPSKDIDVVMNKISKYHDCYQIGEIGLGNEKVVFINELNWE